MNLTIKALVAAAVLASTATAHAGLATGTSATGSSFVLTLLNTTANISATFDLGKTYQDLNISTKTGYAVNDLSGLNLNWNLATDVNYSAAWSSFVSAAGSNFASTVYGVAAVDTSGANSSTGALGLIQSYSGSLATFTSPNMINAANNFDAYLATNNVQGTHVTALDGADFQASADSGYAGVYANSSNPNTLFNVGPVTTGALDSALNLVQFTNVAPTRQVPAAAAVANIFGNGTNLLLSSSGALAYSTVAAVPEANTWAMMAAGLGLMGFIARRRTKG